jgi:hypothetical protein
VWLETLKTQIGQGNVEVKKSNKRRKIGSNEKRDKQALGEEQISRESEGGNDQNCSFAPSPVC